MAKPLLPAQLRRGLVRDDPPEREHDRVVCHRKGAARVLLDQQDGEAPLLDQLFQPQHDLRHDSPGEAERGLVPVVTDATFEKIREIHAMGTAILLVEQNVSRALAFVTRAYVLEGGNVRRFADIADFEAIVTDTGLSTADGQRYTVLGPRVVRV